MRNLIQLFALIMTVVGCQQAPTKVYQTVPTVAKVADPSALVITDQTVVIDARPAFEYSVSHINGSINLRPEDFTQREAPFQGLLELDLFSLTRYLARLGIGPDTPVVVVGRGLKGQGEEGRVAWTLQYLGVKNVRFAAIDYFSLPLTSNEAPPRPNATIWKPTADESLLVTKEDFLKEMKSPRAEVGAALFIDVRPSEEYLGKVSSSQIKKAPDIGAMNIPWTEFFTRTGIPDEKVKAKLESVGVTTDKKIYVIANKGIESAAVTLALRQLGFSKAANFAGGYMQLLSKK